MEYFTKYYLYVHYFEPILNNKRKFLYLLTMFDDINNFISNINAGVIGMY